MRLPNMVTAVVVAHPPRFGAKNRSFNATAAKAMPGVRYVVQIPSGVAVMAGDYWSAKRGRDALQVEWDESNAFTLSSKQILEQYRALANEPGNVGRNLGDTAGAMAKAVKVMEAGATAYLIWPMLPWNQWIASCVSMPVAVRSGMGSR
ncbi:MAG: hypothetical protein AAES65_19445 [Candidatus Thiodiazotropha sp. (ex. Lucinoma kazani)]